MLAYLFVIAAIAFRLLPHEFAFTPVAAALLYFGARGPRRQMWIPVALLAATDVYLTVFRYGFSIPADHFVTWAWYAAAIWIGAKFATGSTLKTSVAAVANSLSFFVVSNFAVWAVWNMYPKTIGGLATAYAMGWPFYQRQLPADLLFTAAFFAIGAAVEHYAPEQARARA